MAKECSICGKSLGFLNGKIDVADGQVCSKCLEKAGLLPTSLKDVDPKKYARFYVSDIKARQGNQDLVANFVATKKVGNVEFNDDEKTFVIRSGGLIKKSELYRYNQIREFELLEDGDSLTKGGLGRAVVGGVLFGGAGAIAGGITGTKKHKNTCISMEIKVTLKDSHTPTAYISFIDKETKHNSILYKQACHLAQDTLSTLQLIVDREDENVVSANSTTVVQVSAADEILKFKQLCDAGVITEEEFQEKKKQLLGL